MKVKNLYESFSSNNISEYTYFLTDDLWDNVSGDVRIEGQLTNYEQRIHAFIESKEEFGRESLEISATFVLVDDIAYITALEGQFTGIPEFKSKKGYRNRLELTLESFTSSENYLQMETLDLLENSLSMKRKRQTRFVIFNKKDEKMYDIMYQHFKRFHKLQIDALDLESRLHKDIVHRIIDYALTESTT